MLETVLQSEIEQVFEALLYGDGFWLSFIIMMAICVVVANKFKYSSVIFCAVLLFVGIEYNARLDPTSNRMWGLVLCFIGACFLCLQLAFDVKDR